MKNYRAYDNEVPTKFAEEALKIECQKKTCFIFNYWLGGTPSNLSKEDFIKRNFDKYFYNVCSSSKEKSTNC